MTHGQVVDRSGRPVAGRLVSNGVAATLSGTDGRWDLPECDQPFVWVHRGGGLDCTDWYHRADEERVVFRMTASAGPRHRFGHLTDLHVDASTGAFGLGAGDCTAERLLDVVAELRDHFGCDAVLATGDLTNRGTLDDFVELRRALDRSPLPVFLIPGNHDHYGDQFEPDGPPATGLHTGWRYEAQLGPRWWSATEAGLRIVAIDWHSWFHGGDADVQRDWLAADLALAEPGTTVLVLSHDLMPRDFFDHLALVAGHVSIAGSLSGHWHTARAEIFGDEVHLNTGNPMFGSWDWSPPHVRVLDLDGGRAVGDRLRVTTRALQVESAHRAATFSAAPVAVTVGEPVRWRATLPGVCHLGGPVAAGATAAGGLVAVSWRDEDRLVGGVSLFGAADGASRWETRLDGAVLARVAVAGDDLAAVTIDGQVAVVDLMSGERRWSSRLDARRGLWICARPLVTADAVVVGSGHLHAGLARADGYELWRRTDLGSHEMYPSYGDGVVVGAGVILGMPSVEPSLYALDATTGDTLWATRATTGGGSPAGSLVWDAAANLVYGLSHRPELFCVDAATGEERFRVPVAGHYTWSAPLVVDDAVLVMAADARLSCFDARDGSARWQVDVPVEEAAGFAPYRGRGRSSITGPVPAPDGRCVTAATDGSIWSVDPGSGRLARLVRLPAAVTAAVVIVDGVLVVATADGSLWGIAVEGP